MGKAIVAIVFSMLMTVGWFTAPAGAAIHDRDCMFPASPFSDAANFWGGATVLIDLDCTGELRPGSGDSHDWWRIPAPVANGGDIGVRVCPLSAGLNTDVEIFLRPTGLPLPPIAQLPPGIPIGASTLPAGCDSITAPAMFNSGGDVYIHVSVPAGAGLYNLVVT